MRGINQMKDHVMLIAADYQKQTPGLHLAGHLVSASYFNPNNSTTRSEMAASGDALMECRICAMEATENELCVPCGCTGSLTYAHPRCVQQWVSRKNLGDTRERGICEICGEAWRIHC